jgi:hypothetical protein
LTPLNFYDVLNRALHVHFCGHIQLPTTILFALGEADVCAHPNCVLSGATFRCARCHAVRYHNRACRNAHHSIYIEFCSSNDWQDYATPFYRKNSAGLRATLLRLAAKSMTCRPKSKAQQSLPLRPPSIPSSFTH